MKKGMKKVWIIAAGVLLWAGYACNHRDEAAQDDAGAPAPLSGNVNVTNFPGGAILQYELPNDPNVLYIQAEYEIRPGVLHRTKVSFYCDTIRVDGFGAVGRYPVNLYCVGRNGKKSDPRVEFVEPETPPVALAFAGLSVVEAFAGVRVFFRNEAEAGLTIEVLIDSLGTGIWEPLDNFPTKQPEGSFLVGGLESKEQHVAVYVRDRWGNKSDTLEAWVTPRFQEHIPKPYAPYHLLSDVDEPLDNKDEFKINSLWDNQYYVFYAKVAPFPRTFTIDLQVSAILNSINIKHWDLVGAMYASVCLKIFEVWGSNVPAPKDDLWGGDWVQLGIFETIKPSGKDGPVTAEDHEYGWTKGDTHEIVPFEGNSNPYVPVRYVRFRVLETFGSSITGTLAEREMDFYGQIQR
ncbi:MAG: DUF4959 domain-containing protein [Bacteroidales bacterium]|jgi:hypothetical protein|nr:DUF4959 domain-containing protein [Bacteroidales bacterium]